MTPDMTYLDELLIGIVVALIGGLFALFGHSASRIGKLESDLKDVNTEMTALKKAHEAEKLDLWARLEESAKTKRRMGDFIDELQHHIWDGKGPPPPPRPEDL